MDNKLTIGEIEMLWNALYFERVQLLDNKEKVMDQDEAEQCEEKAEDLNRLMKKLKGISDHMLDDVISGRNVICCMEIHEDK